MCKMWRAVVIIPGVAPGGRNTELVYIEVSQRIVTLKPES